MSFVPRPARMRWLRDESVFAQRILDRVISVRGLSDHNGTIIVVELETQGNIPPVILEGAYVIRIGPEESVATKVMSVASVDDACWLRIGSWCVFINHDPTRPPLEHGIHLWLGAAWRHVPLARAA